MDVPTAPSASSSLFLRFLLSSMIIRALSFQTPRATMLSNLLGHNVFKPFGTQSFQTPQDTKLNHCIIHPEMLNSLTCLYGVIFFTKKVIYAMLGVSRTIYVNVDSPNLGFPYFKRSGSRRQATRSVFVSE